jgi:hypothetical protein
MHKEFGRKLNDALVAHFEVLYSTLTLRADGTQKFYIIFEFEVYCDCLRKNITRNSKRVQ